MTKELSLPEKIFQNQIAWSTSNWKDTLDQHTKEVEYILNKLNTLNIWSNELQDIESNKNLIPEISIDAYMSLLLANQGLYKYSYVCLRSVLEMSLRLVYFSTHPTEYEWWMDGWFKGKKDVWGEGYSYFYHLKIIKKFNNESTDKQYNLISKIDIVYGQLSNYVHSSPTSFQSKGENFLPIYDTDEFMGWYRKTLEIFDYINILFILCFIDKFKDFTQNDKDFIISNGLEKQNDRDMILKLLQ